MTVASAETSVWATLGLAAQCAKQQQLLTPCSEGPCSSQISYTAVECGESEQECCSSSTLCQEDKQQQQRHAVQITATACSQSQQQCELGQAVLLQGFGWDSCRQHHSTYYEHVQSMVPQIQAAGFSHVWLPPPSASVSAEGYMPQQLYDLNSAYGSQEQLHALLEGLKAAGVAPIADVVINHRCADEQDDSGRWNRYRDKVPHEGPSLAWGPWAIVRDADGKFGGDGQPTEHAVAWQGAPNLDHSNAQVREGLTAWLSWLHTHLGFEGWRFDHAIGYSSRYVQGYVDRTTGQHSLNVGEVWPTLQYGGPGSSLSHCQDAARSQLVDWVQGAGQRAACFDFVSKGVLQEAVARCEYWRLRDAHGQAPGLIGWWPAASVTFVENHDTGSSQRHWPFPDDRLGVGYAYILTHPGLPCVFWEHYFPSSGQGQELRQTIDALMQLRRKHGITSTSSLTIMAAEGDLYMASVAGKLTVKLGPRWELGHLLPDDAQWRIATCGQDFCVWELRDGCSASCAVGGSGSGSASGGSSSPCFGGTGGSAGSLGSSGGSSSSLGGGSAYYC
ncbi:glycoside hydrolase [Scenedesmus sp. NREL 46B-D3]|nr:glycoside hydrolase [Scenedesmus sp. NREL 46B-D3]